VHVSSFWNQTTAALIQALGSGPAGLATDEANRRLSVYGPNDAAAPKRRPACQRFLTLFANPLVIILLFASVLCFWINPPHALVERSERKCQKGQFRFV
jgi:P-type Mg2+ transporter